MGSEEADGQRAMTAEVKLACEAVWKLFGPAPERFLAAHDHRPAPADLAAAGLANASMSVRERAHRVAP